MPLAYGPLKIFNLNLIKVIKGKIVSFLRTIVFKFLFYPLTAVWIAGMGITLTKASSTCTIELGWTPMEHDQAEDRIHRIGQNTKCTYYYLIADGTIDEVIYETLSRKKEMSAKVLEYLRAV